MKTRKEPDLPDLIHQVRERLELDRSVGVSDLILPRAPVQPPAPRPEARAPAEAAPKPPVQPTLSAAPFATHAPVQKPTAPPKPAAPLTPIAQQKADALAALEKQVAQCSRCGLCRTRKNLVFGVGNPDARLMFVGEAPGADEDEQGEPFVGRAGQLLTKIITQGMKIQRADVYIANILKCRPPDNRPPTPTEMVACLPHLMKQIEIIKPAIIVALGSTALNGLTQQVYTISKARGHFMDWNGVKLMPTFHPSYLLRNPAAKKEVWEDIQKVMKALAEKGK